MTWRGYLLGGMAALLLCGCGATTTSDDVSDGSVGDGGGIADAGSFTDGFVPPPGDGPTPFFGAVYAHSDKDLYEVDPDTLEVSHVGAFDWPVGNDEMTDIAIDEVGNMVGISYDKVYAVDKETAGCTYLAPLDRSFNGLSFIPGDEVGSGEEILVGAALDGSVYRIDKTTGVSTPWGDYGGNLGSSGDIVSVSGFGTVATVKEGLGGTDRLARIDPTTGVATIIGDTGFADIWGLGFWRDKVYGFTSDREFVLIDVDTGVATLVEEGAVSWWGAGVTTSAPYIE